LEHKLQFYLYQPLRDDFHSHFFVSVLNKTKPEQFFLLPHAAVLVIVIENRSQYIADCFARVKLKYLLCKAVSGFFEGKGESCHYKSLVHFMLKHFQRKAMLLREAVPTLLDYRYLQAW